MMNKSRLSVKWQTVIPRPVRERLALSPGDTLRYKITDAGVMLEKEIDVTDDPFATFTEWASDEDDAAYADL